MLARQVVDGHLRKTSGAGIDRVIPHLGDAGRGVNRELPHLGDAGAGINREISHLLEYMCALSRRLKTVRIVCGNWERVTKPSVIRSTATNSRIGVFLDPPYSTSGDLYATTNTGTDDGGISESAREWCLKQTGIRIVLCGYDNEHDALIEHGWTVRHGKPGGAGYSKTKNKDSRERLWMSPECIEPQMRLFEGEE